MNKNEFNTRIQKDYDEFKNKIIGLSKEEIFEKAFEIDFKTYLSSYLQTDDILENSVIENISTIEGSILDELYTLYLNIDGSYTYDDMCEELINDFNGMFVDDDETFDSDDDTCQSQDETAIQQQIKTNEEM